MQGDEKVWRWPQEEHSKFMKHELLFDRGLMSEELELALTNGDAENLK